jgi:hypothetical protein
MVAGGRVGKDDRKKIHKKALYLLFCGFDSSMGEKMGDILYEQSRIFLTKANAPQ